MYAKSSGIVTFSVPGFTSAGLCASLMEHERILVSPLEQDSSLVRVSTHVFNTDEEIERLISGVRRIQKSGYLLAQCVSISLDNSLRNE